MNWKEYDKTILTPYEKTGSKAKEFNPETTVFSYMAIRHVAYHAFKAGASSQPVIEAGRAEACDCPRFSDGTKIFPARTCDVCKPPAA